MFSVAMGGVSTNRNIRLLSARRHAGRRPATLHVDNDRRNLGEIGQANKFLHQGNARAGCRRKCPRAIPRGTDDDAYRGKLIFRLHNRKIVFFSLRIDTQLLTIASERFR